MIDTDDFSQAGLMAAAEVVGLDSERLAHDMNDPDIDAYLERTRELATALGINGTPAFIINGDLLSGGPQARSVRTDHRRQCPLADGCPSRGIFGSSCRVRSTRRPRPCRFCPTSSPSGLRTVTGVPRNHQLATIEAVGRGASCLVVAPTGGGKTLAGFLPSLVDLAAKGGGRGLHTLYVAPLKAISVDIARNLGTLIGDIGIDVRLETRTGDSPPSHRRRQRVDPPDILFTTPESLALLASWPESPAIFRDLNVVVVDELHEMAGTKRGDQLSLALSRLAALAPRHRRIGLSATVADPARLEGYLEAGGGVTVITAGGGAWPDIRILKASSRTPWSGHSATHAVADIYRVIRQAATALVFVNTRSQAERVFQELWDLNDDGLEIALHHGSIARESRLKVEAAMAEGSLRAVVCTSTLDLGVDWGAVDLVIQIGAPKGISRMLQRIGLANHRMDEPSRALLVPANRFELLECQAVLDAINDGVLDGAPRLSGGLDVLAQHILGTAAGAPFDPDELYGEIIIAPPYADLDRAPLRSRRRLRRHRRFCAQRL